MHPAYPSLLTASMFGNVRIGTADPQFKLHVAGDIYATGQYLGSDVRLNQNVADLTYGPGEVMKLRPVFCPWKDRSDGKVNLGLIAQEVETVIPELVEKAKDEAALQVHSIFSDPKVCRKARTFCTSPGRWGTPAWRSQRVSMLTRSGPADPRLRRRRTP